VAQKTRIKHCQFKNSIHGIGQGNVAVRDPGIECSTSAEYHMQHRLSVDEALQLGQGSSLSSSREKILK
jgi:hypothetical protein